MPAGCAISSPRSSRPGDPAGTHPETGCPPPASRTRSAGMGPAAGARRSCSSLRRGSGMARPASCRSPESCLPPSRRSTRCKCRTGACRPAPALSPRHSTSCIFCRCRKDMDRCVPRSFCGAQYTRPTLANPIRHRGTSTIYLIVALVILNSIAQRGSKVAVSLYALDLGAGAAEVGILAALFALFPLLLAVQVGRISDRYGVRLPIAAGSVAMAAGLLLPFGGGGLAALFLCPALIGLGHIFFHVSVHSLVGSLGDAAERTKNFSTFALGGSIAAFIGPSAAGFAIELAGYRTAFALLAAAAAAPSVYVLLHRAVIPRHVRHTDEGAGKSSMDLLAIPSLRRTLIMSGVALTGIELFSFYLP